MPWLKGKIASSVVKYRRISPRLSFKRHCLKHLHIDSHYSKCVAFTAFAFTAPGANVWANVIFHPQPCWPGWNFSPAFTINPYWVACAITWGIFCPGLSSTPGLKFQPCLSYPRFSPGLKILPCNHSQPWVEIRQACVKMSIYDFDKLWYKQTHVQSWPKLCGHQLAQGLFTYKSHPHSPQTMLMPWFLSLLVYATYWNATLLRGAGGLKKER